MGSRVCLHLHAVQARPPSALHHAPLAILWQKLRHTDMQILERGRKKCSSCQYIPICNMPHEPFDYVGRSLPQEAYFHS